MKKENLLFCLLAWLPLIGWGAENGSLRLMSYNVRVCSNKLYDQKIADYKSIATIIRYADPDVVALQELDSCANRTSNVDQLKNLAERTGMFYYYASNRTLPGGSYGLGLLYKKELKPLREYKVLMHPENGDARVVGVLEFKEFVMACTHLHLVDSMKLVETDLITEVLGKYTDKPVFVAGDFNSLPNSEPIMNMRKNWDVISLEKNTFPSRDPIKCIDFIMHLKNGSSIRVLNRVVLQSVPDADVSQDSDHLPIYVDITLGKSSALFGGGDGTESNPFIIANATHLNNIRYIDWEVTLSDKPYFQLTSDIDLEGFDWEPIKNTRPYCQIHFDGNGHIIKNMTCLGYAYASLFGVLCGTCKRTGIIDADISSSGQGAGAFAGYVGIKVPASVGETACIEECYASGKVSATNAAGGIAGNIGQPFGNDSSRVTDCYSTCEVSVTRENSAGSYAGGIVGIIWGGGILKNGYATGDIRSVNSFGAGGIAGYSLSDIWNCVALNGRIINQKCGNLGRISAFMIKNGTVPQGIDCWGWEGTVLDNGGTLQEAVNTGFVKNKEAYDGITRSSSFLRTPENYVSIWNMPDVWCRSSTCEYPLLSWVGNRADCKEVNGYSGTKTVISDEKYDIIIYARDRRLYVSSSSPISSVSLWDVQGRLISKNEGSFTSETCGVKNGGLYILNIEKENINIFKKVWIP